MMLLRVISKKSTETAQSLVIQAKKKIEEISNKDGLSGIPSGFSELDKLTSGWQPSDLVIIAARPGMGKNRVNFINGQKYGSCSKYSYSILFFRDVLNSINYKINFIRDWTIL